MRYLLYHENRENESPPFGDTGWWVRKFCGWYGVQPVALTPTYTIEHAVEDEQFSGYSWVWLDARAGHGLAAVPTENVVFCIGDDRDGFAGFEGEGLRCHLRSMHPDGVSEDYHAAVCASLVLHEVYG